VLKRKEECDTYLTHVCRHHWSGKSPVKRGKYKELSANTVAFIRCRRSLTKVLAGAARGEKGSKDGGGRVSLSNVDTGKLTGLKYKLISHYKLPADMSEVASRSL
jgi:hypothetical protein